MRTFSKEAALSSALGAYKEIVSGISIERLKETCQAERENRLVVLPCMAGELEEMLCDLESVGSGDSAETYTTGYRNGYRNGRIELLRYIFNMPDGTQEVEVELEGVKHDA